MNTRSRKASTKKTSRKLTGHLHKAAIPNPIAWIFSLEPLRSRLEFCPSFPFSSFRISLSTSTGGFFFQRKDKDYFVGHNPSTLRECGPKALQVHGAGRQRCGVCLGFSFGSPFPPRRLERCLLFSRLVVYEAIFFSFKNAFLKASVPRRLVFFSFDPST